LINRKFKIYIFVIILTNTLILSCTSVDYFKRNGNGKDDIIKSNGDISLVTYNIKAIYEKEENQIQSLMSFINNNRFDFVVFQELFDENTRDEIIEIADPNFYYTIISRVDYNSFPELLFQDAGLFMMSRYPVIDLSPIDFGSEIKNSNGIIHMILEKEFSRTNDFLANKSVLGSLFNINDSTKLFLFTAHVQAAGTTEHKQYQLSQIKTFITNAVDIVIGTNLIDNPRNLAVILAGDFNSNAYDNNRFSQFRKLLGYPRDLHKDFHEEHEEYTFRNRARRYDYILSYDKMGDTDLKSVVVKSINVENVVDDSGESISDHRGIKTNLKIN